jgi:hypothetical protein
LQAKTERFINVASILNESNSDFFSKSKKLKMSLTKLILDFFSYQKKRKTLAKEKNLKFSKNTLNAKSNSAKRLRLVKIFTKSTKLKSSKKELLEIESSDEKLINQSYYTAVVIHVNIDYQNHFTRAHMTVRGRHRVPTMMLEWFSLKRHKCMSESNRDEMKSMREKVLSNEELSTKYD